MAPRILQVRTKILKHNDTVARELRERFTRAGVYVVSMVSAPGTGKTALLRETLTRLRARGLRVAAVVGDLATDNDAARLAASGAPVKQIVTGTVCHLEAQMVVDALADWSLDELHYLFIENVGNLVCPASYDLGEHLRIALLSTTEGEDKPLKYPTLFNTSDVAVVTKLDLAHAVECDIVTLHANLRDVRPAMEIFDLSTKTGEGVEKWIEFLESRRLTAANAPADPTTVAAP